MTYPMLPPHRPQLSKDEALERIKQFNTSKYDVKLLAIRGYFKKTMGDASCNDFGLYDDALFIISPTMFEPFNSNTDPSKQTPGLAVITAPQMILYKRGIHKISVATKAQINQMVKTGKDIPGIRPHWALRQYSAVTTLKNGKRNTDTLSARRWTNCHRGGIYTTSSEACQTLPPSQWSEFYDEKLIPELKEYKQLIVPYCIIEA